MNEFYRALKQHKYSKIIAILILLFASVGGFLLNRSLSWYDLTPELKMYLRHGGTKTFSNAQLFLPSPLELYLLDTNESLWPDTFNPQQTLSPDKLPELYTLALKAGHFDAVTPSEIEQARQRSVMVHTGHLDALQSTLSKASPKQIESETECSPMMQDTLFYMGVAWPELNNSFIAYLKKCDSKNLHLFWNKLKTSIENGDAAKLREISLELQKNMENLKGEFSRWLTMEVSQWAHIMAANIDSKTKAN